MLYHGRGFTPEFLYSLPTADRRYYVKRLKEQLDAERKAQQEEVRKAKAKAGKSRKR